MSKLTEADVVAIRAAHEAGELNTDLAIRYNVSKLTISKIVNRRSWKHI
jgi:Mor family transcriptional regulator